MAKGSSKAVQAKYAVYQKEQTWLKNKKARQARHLKAHPNDEQSKTLNTSYGRKTPNTRMWTSVTKEMAQLFKQVYGKCHNGIFSANPVLVTASMHELAVRQIKLPRQTGHFFAISERARGLN